MKKHFTLTAEELDEKFDAGENMIEHLDLSTLDRPGVEPKRINIDLPDHVLKKLDRQAALRGVTRQSLIKMWLYERLEAASK
jgi:hypothetical protein